MTRYLLALAGFALIAGAWKLTLDVWAAAGAYYVAPPRWSQAACLSGGFALGGAAASLAWAGVWLVCRALA